MRAPLSRNRPRFVVPAPVFIAGFVSVIVLSMKAVCPVHVAADAFGSAATCDAVFDGRGVAGSDSEMNERAEDIAEALRARGRVRVTDFDHGEWAHARPVRVTRYWSGAEAPRGRHAEARVVWDEEALSVRFVYLQEEPAVVAEAPRVDRKTVGLWERDVCEVFVAPDAQRPEKYFEFEAAPTGEWLDLAIVWRPDERETDWEFRSGMKAAARVAGKEVTIVMRVPWSAFGRTPRAGERWRVNFFRCAGRDPDRGYMAWRPTRTPEPSFHVPQAFGELEFKK